MKKSDLKQLIKPLVKECIHEVLIEEGLLSNVVAEVAKGMQGNLVVETKRPPPPREDLQMVRKSREANTKLQEHRRKMMDSVGRDAYNGVNVFENVEPIRGGTPGTAAGQGPLSAYAANDPGVDISALMSLGAGKNWKNMI